MQLEAAIEELRREVHRAFSFVAVPNEAVVYPALDAARHVFDWAWSLRGEVAEASPVAANSADVSFVGFGWGAQECSEDRA